MFQLCKAFQISSEDDVNRSGEVVVETKAPSFNPDLPTFCHAQYTRVLAAQGHQKDTPIHFSCLAMAKSLRGRLSQIFTIHPTRYKLDRGVE